MGVVMLQVLCLVLKISASLCILVLQGSEGLSSSPSPSIFSAFPPIQEGTPIHGSPGNGFRNIGPSPTPLPNGTAFSPSVEMPPSKPASVPQPSKGLAPSVLPVPPIIPTPISLVPPPVTSRSTSPALSPSALPEKPQHPGNKSLAPETPAARPSLPAPVDPSNPPTARPFVPSSPPQSAHKSKAAHGPVSMPVAPPVVDVPAPSIILQNPPPAHSTKPEVPPSVLPAPVANSPRKLPQGSPAIQPELPGEPPSGKLPHDSPAAQPELPGEPPSDKLPHNSAAIQPELPGEPPSDKPGNHVSPALTPLPGVKWEGAHEPAVAPQNRSSHQYAPLNSPPPKAHTKQRASGNTDTAPPPLPSQESSPDSRIHSPASSPSTYVSRHRHHQAPNTMIPSPPPSMVHPPASTMQGQSIPPSPLYHSVGNPKTNFMHHAPPPYRSVINDSLEPSPSPTSHTRQSERPPLPPKVSPPKTLPRTPKMPTNPPIQALPPPPPNEDCSSLTCTEPLTNGPPGSPCVCVMPMQVGLRLGVALYTFFPLVSEIAAEIASGVYMKQSQVRIMGANSATQDPEKTIVLIYLLPLGENFDYTTAFFTFQRFWHKQVVIKSSQFGDYDVLYVRYPGLPPSPPSSIGIIESEPYPGQNNNGMTMKPLGVDVSKNRHKDGGPKGSTLAIIVLSASVAVILFCAAAWVLLLKYRGHVCESEPTPPTTARSLAKSSGVAASMIGSGLSSSISYGSSLVPYTGSAKTFTSGDIQRATDNFNETRVLGEGGFGRVYSGFLENGTPVAAKILKRDDQQGGREFLAEVEMLSRLHHRNLVKLIGICTEERMRCLVYELIPNGSVESHLHGIHKETAPLDWSARMKIALGAARGLAYLHEDSSPRVIHRDFKSSNILLEHDFTPKVSDFGLARTAMDEESRHISTRVMGTFGYVAPEYAMTGHLLVKSDVYSYGVVLLELLTGRKPVDMSQPPGQENLVSWARPLLATTEGLESIVDSTLGPNFPLDSITKVAAIASMCVQPEVSNRPFMGEVVQALKLVCNECDETKELGSKSSIEDLSIDMEAAGVSTSSGHLLDPLHAELRASPSDCEFDVERGLSVSDLLSPEDRRQEFRSSRRHSSSGPISTKRSRKIWQRMRRYSGGAVSEHGVMFRLRPGSH